jgi:hypothetical protein
MNIHSKYSYRFILLVNGKDEEEFVKKERKTRVPYFGFTMMRLLVYKILFKLFYEGSNTGKNYLYGGQ